MPHWSDRAGLGYDPMGRYFWNAGPVLTLLFYDGSAHVEERSGSNALLRRYIHGPGADAPLVWYEGSGTTDKRWPMSEVGLVENESTILRISTFIFGISQPRCLAMMRGRNRGATPCCSLQIDQSHVSGAHCVAMVSQSSLRNIIVWFVGEAQ